MFSLSNIKENITASKIIITLIISIFLIIVIIELISHFSEKVEEKKIEDASPNTTFFSEDGTISLNIAKKYDFKQFHSNKNYLIELRTNHNLDIFISHKDFIEGKNLSEVIAADKRAFLEQFNYSNTSDPQNINIPNIDNSFTYSFQYLDNNIKKAYYLQVIWIETENGYYIIDIEFPVEYMNYFAPVITDTVSGFKIN